jgi:hypothetical protein
MYGHWKEFASSFPSRIGTVLSFSLSAVKQKEQRGKKKKKKEKNWREKVRNKRTEE